MFSIRAICSIAGISSRRCIRGFWSISQPGSMWLYITFRGLYREWEHAHWYVSTGMQWRRERLIQRKGESVPVSKSPLTDDALGYLNLSAPSVHPNIAKHFLFSGTKVIRARRPQNVDDDEAIALAIVVRTGFLTTKGALVRSMLFPKPSGFKFYRDSFRYISVMAVIAFLGFIASFINFIRLGVSSPQLMNTRTYLTDSIDSLSLR